MRAATATGARSLAARVANRVAIPRHRLRRLTPRSATWRRRSAPRSEAGLRPGRCARRARWPSRSGVACGMPRRRRARRRRAGASPLAAIGRAGRFRGRPRPPGRGTRIGSGPAASCVPSGRCPGVRTPASGRPWPSPAGCRSVVGPPRRRPGAPPVGPPAAAPPCGAPPPHAGARGPSCGRCPPPRPPPRPRRAWWSGRGPGAGPTPRPVAGARSGRRPAAGGRSDRGGRATAGPARRWPAAAGRSAPAPPPSVPRARPRPSPGCPPRPPENGEATRHQADSSDRP